MIGAVASSTEHCEQSEGLRAGQPGAQQGARDVVFVDHLPRNPSGKVLKHELEVLGPGPVGDAVNPGADPEPRG